jgi:excisionase family DNA binding protein/PAS domain S-box-containing protein
VNLKQAARRLGVHYQTAYKLVRSGKLAAVAVGGRYEISEAALERYVAERQAMRRAPARSHAKPAPPSSDPFAAAHAALDAIALSGTTVMELVADALVAELGDLAVARELSHDGQWFLPAVVRHADPARRATVTATLGEAAAEVHGSRVLQSVANGATVLKALVPQDCVRSRVDPEAVQYFEHAGIHSMIVAPATHAGEVLGLVAVTRDEPGRPYTRAHIEVVERAAHIVGAAVARARLAAESWNRRRALVAALSSLLDAGASGPSVHTVVANGPVAEFVCDAKGRVLAANVAAGRLLEVTANELVGRTLVDLLEPSEREPHVALLERLLRGEFAYADRSVSSSTVRQLATRLAVVRDAHTQPRAIVAIFHELPKP